MNRYALLVAAMAVTLVGGCASTDTKTDGQQSADSQDDSKYTVTGSRIPRKDKNAASVKSMDSQDSQDTMRQVQPLIVAPTGGGR